MPTQVHSDANLLSVTEFCRRNGICRSSFYNFAAKGLIRFVKLGSKTVVPLTAERDFLVAIGAIVGEAA